MPVASTLMDLLTGRQGDLAAKHKWFTSPGQLSFLRTFLNHFIEIPSWRTDPHYDPRNIEHVLDACTMAAKLDLALPWPGGKAVSASYVVDLILWWMLEAIEASAKRELPDAYGVFAAGLVPGDTIVTVNYDLVCETYLAKRGLRFDYGIPELARNSTSTQGVPINLLKLHGSLNWRHCVPMPGRSSCERWFVYDHDLPAFGFELSQACECGDGALRTPVIAPTSLKDYSGTSLAGVWKRAARQMRAATELYVVGYSLPLYDVTVRELFRLVTIANTAGPVHIVNPDSAVRERLSFVEAQRLIFHQEVFSVFAAKWASGAV